MLRCLVGVFVIAACRMALPDPAVSAEEARYELKTSVATIKDVLQENTGKRIIVRLETGGDLEGTVIKVGEQVVHIARLSGRDFYDAVVRIDRISAVVFKVRG